MGSGEVGVGQTDWVVVSEGPLLERRLLALLQSQPSGPGDSQAGLALTPDQSLVL